MDSEGIKNEVRTLLEKMGFGEEIESVEIHEGAATRISLKLRRTQEEAPGGEDLSWNQRVPLSSMLIGERGNNLIALEHLIKKLLYKRHGEEKKFSLDINDYRMRRLEDLKQDVKAAAKEVRLYKKEVPLRPMSSFERRIVHLLLAEYPDITTGSIGEEPDRKVVIKPYP